MLIIYTAIVSKWNLKFKFYTHHYVGVFLIIIAFVIYTISDLINHYIIIGEYNLGLIIPILILNQISTAIQECTEKYLMDFKFYSPFSLLFFEGLTSFIVISLLFYPLSKLNCPKTGVFCQIKDEAIVQKVEDFFETLDIIKSNAGIALMAIIYMFSYFFYNLIRIYTNKTFSPCHRSVADLFASFLTWIITTILAYKEKLGIIRFFDVASVSYTLFMYCFSTLSVLIFLEMVIISACGMGTGTEVNILRRAKDEEYLLTSIIERGSYMRDSSTSNPEPAPIDGDFSPKNDEMIDKPEIE